MVLGKRSRAPKRYGARRVKRRVMRVPRRIPTEAVSIQRTFCMGLWQPSTAATTDFWKQYAFRLSDMPSFANFTGIFDLYRINGIKVTFRPRYGSFDGANTTDIVLPGVTNQSGVHMHVLNDKTQTEFPSGLYTRANLNTFLENGKVKSYTGLQPISIYVKKPVTYRTVDGTATAQFTASPWLTTQTFSQHYGFQAFAQDTNFNGSFGQSWDVFYTYYLQFKGIR